MVGPELGNNAPVGMVERAIDADLEELAKSVIRRHLDMERPDTRNFLCSPDGRDQHQTRWHQWGILTHTRVFLRHFDEDIPHYLSEWGLSERVGAFLARSIDGASRRELLRIAILLHDIGKFGARVRGRERFHFTGHETLSGSIIRREIDLARYGLTRAQSEYIALTAEDHFVLGLVRKRAREQGGYNDEFVRSSRFVAIAEEIKRDHPDDFVEIGVLFLGDSLAKADPARGPHDAVRQYQINIDVAHRYLATVLNSPV